MERYAKLLARAMVPVKFKRNEKIHNARITERTN